MAAEKRELPPGIAERLKTLVSELEAKEREKARVEGGEIELKVNMDEALWYVAYRTVAQ